MATELMYLTANDCAKAIGLSMPSFYAACKRGDFPFAIRIGSRWILSKPAFERWMQGKQCQQQPVAAQGS